MFKHMLFFARPLYHDRVCPYDPTGQKTHRKVGKLSECIPHSVFAGTAGLKNCGLVH